MSHTKRGLKPLMSWPLRREPGSAKQQFGISPLIALVVLIAGCTAESESGPVGVEQPSGLPNIASAPSVVETEAYAEAITLYAAGRLRIEAGHVRILTPSL